MMTEAELMEVVREMIPQAIDELYLLTYAPDRAALFAPEMGYPLPLACWSGCNFATAVPSEKRKELRELLRELGDEPDVVVTHWAAIANDGVGNHYFLTCEPDAHGCRPVYFVAHDPAEYYLVASDLWYFLYGFLLKAEHRLLHKDDEDFDYSFWCPYEREQVLAFDPALRYYEGTGLLPWEQELQETE